MMNNFDSNKWMRAFLIFLLGAMTVFLVSNTLKSGASCLSAGSAGSVCGTCAVRGICPAVDEVGPPRRMNSRATVTKSTFVDWEVAKRSPETHFPGASRTQPPASGAPGYRSPNDFTREGGNH